jgi:hypothetical protein
MPFVLAVRSSQRVARAILTHPAIRCRSFQYRLTGNMACIIFYPMTEILFIVPVHKTRIVANTASNASGLSNEEVAGFHLSNASVTVVSDVAPSHSAAQTRRPHRRARLTPEKRLQRFNQLFEFVSKGLASRPRSAAKVTHVRQSAWIHLFGLATTPEQLRKVAGLFPRWRDFKRVFDPHHAEMFVRELSP